MSNPNSPVSWIVRRLARWSMPACLQPRAARRFRIVRAEDKRPARQSALGCHLRTDGHYQLEVTIDGDGRELQAVSIVAGPLRRANAQEQRSVEDGRTIIRYDLEFDRRDETRRHAGRWWSRHELVVARLEYDDGRDDCEHALWVVTTPRRGGVLLALISSAVLYGLVPWASRRILETESLSAAAAQILRVAACPAVWQGLMLVIAGLWLGVTLTDRVHLAMCGHRLRRQIRDEVQHFSARAVQSLAAN